MTMTQIESLSFTDASQHARSVHDWDQTYDQLSPGRFASRLRQLCSGPFQIFHEQLNRRIVQYGQSPAERMCFSIPLCTNSQGTQNCLAILNTHEEFMFHAPENTQIFAATFARDKVLSLAALNLSPRSYRQLTTAPSLQSPWQRTSELHQRIRQQLGQALDCTPQRFNEATAKLMEHSLLGGFLDLLGSVESAGKRRRPSVPARQSLVKMSQQIALASHDEPITILDLCQRLHVSRRALQYSFQTIADTNPVDYLRSVRLNAVRRRLAMSSPAEVSIGDAAAQWGFYHLSHFASQYKALFGELPSQTLRQR